MTGDASTFNVSFCMRECANVRKPDERSVKILFWWAREGVGWFGLGERSMPFGAFWCEES